MSEQRAVQARDDLLAVVSHDLRSPLSTIVLLSDVLASHPPPADAATSPLRHDVPARIRSAATHMKALIDDLLDLAKIEANRFVLRPRSVESIVMIEEALLAAAPLGAAKRITLASPAIE